MWIVVAFLVVNFFTKMVITRHLEVERVPEVVEMNPTSLPELIEQPRISKIWDTSDTLNFRDRKS